MAILNFNREYLVFKVILRTKLLMTPYSLNIHVEKTRINTTITQKFINLFSVGLKHFKAEILCYEKVEKRQKK